MRITDKQQQVLDSLICERLSSSEANMRLVDDFYNISNDHLVDPLRNEAFGEDEDGVIAYYIVKHPDGQILFYFSLKCGLLYDNFGLIDAESLRTVKKLYNHLVDMKKSPDTTQDEKEYIDSLLENLRTRKGLIKSDIDKIARGKTDDIVNELQKEFTDNIKRVGKTFSAVEIVHFCKNDKYEELWQSLGLNNKIGTVMFWHFIVQKIVALKEIVGCEYVFLFAADYTADEFLVNYYKTEMKFSKPDSQRHGTAQPLYDIGCQFLYQPTKELETNKRTFFDGFNREEDAV